MHLPLQKLADFALPRLGFETANLNLPGQGRSWHDSVPVWFDGKHYGMISWKQNPFASTTGLETSHLIPWLLLG